MSAGTPGFVVLYRWRVRPEFEREFVAAWSRLTDLLRAGHGSLGSRLHRGADGVWYAIAQWPSREHRTRAFAAAVDPGASATLRAATIESFPEVELEIVAGAFATP